MEGAGAEEKVKSLKAIEECFYIITLTHYIGECLTELAAAQKATNVHLATWVRMNIL